MLVHFYRVPCNIATRTHSINWSNWIINFPISFHFLWSLWAPLFYFFIQWVVCDWEKGAVEMLSLGSYHGTVMEYGDPLFLQFSLVCIGTRETKGLPLFLLLWKSLPESSMEVVCPCALVFCELLFLGAQVLLASWRTTGAFLIFTSLFFLPLLSELNCFPKTSLVNINANAHRWIPLLGVIPFS